MQGSARCPWSPPVVTPMVAVAIPFNQGPKSSRIGTSGSVRWTHGGLLEPMHPELEDEP